ncbi:hypothetical protein QFC19_005335 [Naganishia cerealis]|uniref:Uncharacterized protein n=1 Tax=Naganishia cerealis TaxID=610337 RepID=A0ACC2VPA4_9TREE|nr:hypothetical protein QFC19_005335 [Naganishia cerealis]
MSHMPSERPFRGSLDVNEWAAMDAYELNELDFDESINGKPEAQTLLGEDVEGKQSMDAAEDGSREDSKTHDLFSMDEMIARVSGRHGRLRYALGLLYCNSQHIPYRLYLLPTTLQCLLSHFEQYF